MTISLAITSYNRYEMTVESFALVIDDPRIDDIVVLDDCSTDGSYEKLRDHFKENDKVRVIRQAQNRGMSLNKRDAIALAKNDWVIIFDSDNILDDSYLDELENEWNLRWPRSNEIYCPSFARPDFDYRALQNYKIDKWNIGSILSGRIGNTANMLLNTCNYVVNKTEYLKIYQHNDAMKGTDTVWFNYLWLSAGNSFYVVPEMDYYHRIHDDSGFLQDADYNMKQSEKIKQMIMSLCTTSNPTN